jgi:hypothetical protein
MEFVSYQTDVVNLADAFLQPGAVRPFYGMIYLENAVFKLTLPLVTPSLSISKYIAKARTLRLVLL